MRVDLLVHSKKPNNPTTNSKLAHASNNEPDRDFFERQQIYRKTRFENCFRYPKRDPPNVQRQEIQKYIYSGCLTTKKTVRHPQAKKHETTNMDHRRFALIWKQERASTNLNRVPRRTVGRRLRKTKGGREDQIWAATQGPRRPLYRAEARDFLRLRIGHRKLKFGIWKLIII